MAVNVKKTTHYKIIIGILIIIIAGFVLLSIFLMQLGNQKMAEENVAALYGVISEDAEVVKTVEQNGLYKITVRFTDATGRDSVQDVFVTKDGAMLTDRLVNMKDQINTLQRQSDFAQCLFDKQVRVFGLSNDPITQAQLQLLGTFSGRVFFDCSANQQVCQQLNVTIAPSTLLNSQIVSGLQTLDWFEENTGCSLEEAT